MLTQQQQAEIVQAAIFAPSADNSQPFKFNWQSDNELSLYIDKTRSGKASDNRFVLSDIALGAIIENTCLKAAALNFSAEVDYLPNTSNEYHVADISFSPADNIDSTDKSLATVIESRCTDRRFPFKGPIAPEAIDKLNQSTQAYSAGIKWFTDKNSIKQVLPVIQKAESVRFKSETLHQELFSTVHFDNPSVEEGMPIEVLAIEKPAQPMFKLMKKWSVMNFFNKIGAYAMLGIRSVRIPILFSPALALITIKDNDRISVIEGGRALQRFWLQATLENLSIQPYAAPGIFSLGFINCESQFKKNLQHVSSLMKEQVENGYGLMFFRIGKHSKVHNRTHRRPMESFKL
ncbi:hypothetical protein HII17_03090 [Thalassotalea sp. M1531]|uniref:Nitroreductase domain-containing protein n=1 Tax=Thalassotalea algicola TaxID=2716224 RepID=A0A7Y0LA92_9GAMM|nr:nitroreductase family protein [Thalassotalea algicola]NMP30539.1 hypothetical protein [Thalassotalea algicola]